ncbi:MAG: hypothetical protein WDO24_17055 [Pseudomonadota bacterium]
MRGIPWFQTVVTGYFVAGSLRGVSQVVLDRSLCPRAAEVAVTVEDAVAGPRRRPGIDSARGHDRA